MIKDFTPDDLDDYVEQSEELMDKLNVILNGHSAHTSVSALLKLAVLPFVMENNRPLWDRATDAVFKGMKCDLGERCEEN